MLCCPLFRLLGATHVNGAVERVMSMVRQRLKRCISKSWSYILVNLLVGGVRIWILRERPSDFAIASACCHACPLVRRNVAVDALQHIS